MVSKVQKYRREIRSNSDDLRVAFLSRLSHESCVIWRKGPVWFGVETLHHLANAGWFVWRMEFFLELLSAMHVPR